MLYIKCIMSCFINIIRGVIIKKDILRRQKYEETEDNYFTRFRYLPPALGRPWLEAD